MKKKIGIFFVASLISLFIFDEAKAQNTRGEAVVASATVTATVTKINHKTRKVNIKTADGQEYKLVVSTDVQNLEQVKKGDVITALYTEALAYEVKKSGTTGAGTTAAAAAANPGEKPAGAVAQQTTVTVKITAIDTNTPSVTVKGPDGDVETIKVKDPSKLNGLKVGDTVDITYTEAFAIKVDATVKK
jgi:Cu/Ag efflux protein CusF